MRIQIAPSIFSLLLIGVLSVNLACSSQSPIVEQQKGEIDYLTRENEELHRLLAQMEAEGRSLDNKEQPVAAASPSEPQPGLSSTRVLQAETISDEKRIESTDDIPEPEIQIQKVDPVETPTSQVETSLPDLTEEMKEVKEEVVPVEVIEIPSQDVFEAVDSEEIAQEITLEDEGDIIVESSQAPSYVDQPELYEDDSETEEGMTEEEAERLAWENRPRQRPQAPLASLSTRQFFEDGTADLTRSAKIYLKLVATILGREHKDSVIEIESQDVDDEPELLSDRLNTVLQELERKMPGILDRVILLETPLTYSNSKKIEDPHHIKFYPVKLGDQ